MDNSPAIAWMKDDEGRHLYLSPPYLERIHFSGSDWFGKTDHDLWPPEVADRFRSEDRKVLESGAPLRLESTESFTSREDEQRTWWVIKFPIADDSGKRYVGGIAVEITEQKRALEALRVQFQMNESMIQTARNIVLVLDPDGRIERFNPFFESLVGWPLEEVKGLACWDVLETDFEREELQKQFESSFDDDRKRGLLTTICTRAGELREIEWYNNSLTKEGGQLVGFLCIGVDVSERRLLEREIERISAHEQRRLGQELHDNVGQEMTALSLLSASLNEELARCEKAGLLESSAAGPIRTLSEKLSQTIQSANRNLQSVSRGLLPEPIDVDDLIGKLSDFSSFISERKGVVCRVRCSDKPRLSDPAAANHLYRIAQEATNNAIKHSRCQTIEITLRSTADDIVLEISDDGVGMEPAMMPAQELEPELGMGLRIMHYRAELIGAELTFGFVNETKTYRGTVVRCALRKHF